MPPLAFAHLKKAAAERGAELKSMPPLAVVSARTLIGLPLAGLPLPIPHLAAVADVFSFPTSESLLFPDDPPQAATPARTASVSATARAARTYLVMLHLLQNPRRSIGSGCGREMAAPGRQCRSRRSS